MTFEIAALMSRDAHKRRRSSENQVSEERTLSLLSGSLFIFSSLVMSTDAAVRDARLAKPLGVE